MKTRGSLAITATRKSETLHWRRVRRAVLTPSCMLKFHSTPFLSSMFLIPLQKVSISSATGINIHSVLDDILFKQRKGFWSVYYLTLSNSLIITLSLLFQSKLPQHLWIKEFPILFEKFITVLHISLPIVQREQNFIHLRHFPVKAFQSPPTCPQAMPTGGKIQ